MDAYPAGLAEISQGLLSCGVTSYLPTTSATAPPQKLAQVCQLLGEKAHEISGAKIQGIYLGDLYFMTEHKGAQNQRICAINFVELERLQADRKRNDQKDRPCPRTSWSARIYQASCQKWGQGLSRA